MESSNTQLNRAIFISYRRSDSADITGRIYDRLAEHFRETHVFKDVDSIQPGATFADYILETIGQSAVELVIIGPRWLTISSGWNRRRLDDPGDYVRLEIETALRQGVPVIPILVMGATMPPSRRLPNALKQLVERNGLQVRPDPDFRRDMDRVITAIEYWMRRPRSAHVATAPAQPMSGREATTAPVTPAPPTLSNAASGADEPPTTSTEAVSPPTKASTSHVDTPTSPGDLPIVSTNAGSAAESATPVSLAAHLDPLRSASEPALESTPAKLRSDSAPARRRRVRPIIAVVALALVVALLAFALRSLSGVGGSSSTGLTSVDATNTTLAATSTAQAVQATLAANTNLAMGAIAYASASAGGSPANAVDGDGFTHWSAGAGAPQWIEIDLGSPHNLAAIRLQVSMYPNGDTDHRLLVRGPSGSFHLAHEFVGPTTDYQWLEYRPATPLKNIQFIRVETVRSPSWVSWFEIEAIASPE